MNELEAMAMLLERAGAFRFPGLAFSAKQKQYSNMSYGKDGHKSSVAVRLRDSIPRDWEYGGDSSFASRKKIIENQILENDSAKTHDCNP